MTIGAKTSSGRIDVDFTFAAGRGRIASVDAALATPLGVVRELIPAARAGIDGPRGGGRLPLDLMFLPAGRYELTLSLVDARGLQGPAVSGAFDVAGGGGDGPELLAVKALADQITRPGGDDVVLARFVVAGKARTDEPTAVWVRMRAPGGSESAAAGVVGLVDDRPVEVTLGAFGSSDDLGEYVAAVSLVDLEGNVSQPFETTLELVGDGGVAGPSIAEFSPSTAHAGEKIVVSGRGLDPDDLGVEVAGVAAPILSADGETMRIRMPDVDRPGSIVVSGRMGAGVSAGELAPRIGVHVVPDVVSVPEGRRRTSARRSRSRSPHPPTPSRTRTSAPVRARSSRPSSAIRRPASARPARRPSGAPSWPG